mgnify:CR=1 FL=1
METSIYQKLLYIYYLEYTTHHNFLSIPSHFPFIPSHFPPIPSLCDVVFTTSFPSSLPISSLHLSIPSTNKAIRAFRSRSHEPGDKSSPEPLKSALIASYVTFYPLNTIQTPVKCHMNVIWMLHFVFPSLYLFISLNPLSFNSLHRFREYHQFIHFVLSPLFTFQFFTLHSSFFILHLSPNLSEANQSVGTSAYRAIVYQGLVLVFGLIEVAFWRHRCCGSVIT